MIGGEVCGWVCLQAWCSGVLFKYGEIDPGPDLIIISVG